jgi:poly-gamma-glutamate capsule biosynthesis protein CapA/YwtB (metallophosphatase superfamily)
MKTFLNLAIAIGCLNMGLARAEIVSITGQITGEDGFALDGVTMQFDGQEVATDESGKFELMLDAGSAAPRQIRVASAGYYSTLQTLQRSDFVTGKSAVLPTIELVRKKVGRRLLMFAGDAMLSRRYFTPRAGEPVLVRKTHIVEDGKALLQHVKPYIDLADYASVNLETQLSDDPLVEGLPKSVTFYSPPELAEILQWAGFDYTALGNNHMYDYRDAGLRSTFETLDRLQLAYSGGGFDDAGARKPAVAEIGNRTHAFFSYVGWAGSFTPSQVAEESKGGAALGNERVIKEDLDMLPDSTTAVLQLHAGLEYSARPAMSEQTTMRQAVRDGADIVIGHHPHVLQGFEIVDDRLIAYSMGNFLFDQYHYTTQLGMLLFVWMDDDKLHRAEIVPMHVNGYVPTPATGVFRSAILHRLAKHSDPGSVCLRPNGLHATLKACADGEGTQSQRVAVDTIAGASSIVALRDLGASPLVPTDIINAGSPYRLGVDILRRGDFEYTGMFGTDDRTWIVDDHTELVSSGNPRLQIDMRSGITTVLTGLKVFERIFTTSNPATVSGRIKVSEEIQLRALLQRRRTTDSLGEALADGPTTEIGSVTLTPGAWQNFSFEYNQPRIETRSIRLLFEMEDLSGDGARAELDDIKWIEWSTPWIDPDDSVPPTYATYLQFQQ